MSIGAYIMSIIQLVFHIRHRVVVGFVIVYGEICKLIDL